MVEYPAKVSGVYPGLLAGSMQPGSLRWLLRRSRIA